MDETKTQQITQKQQEATNLENSVWVSASAGSGKTSVLTARLIRLLLNDIPPSKILCLTFTKNAATEMRNRINKKLSEWVLLPDDKLTNDIKILSGQNPTAKILQNARRLFAKILDNADELKILTIHSFCQQIMKKFPFEAGIIPNFEIADERTGKEFLVEAKKDLLLKNFNLKTKLAIEKIAVQINQTDFAKLLSKLLEQRDKLTYLLKICHSVEGIIEEIYKKLNLDSALTEEKVYDNFLTQQVDVGGFEKIYNVVQEFGSKTEKPKFEILKIWINQPDKRRENCEAYQKFFLTEKEIKQKNLITKKPKSEYPASQEILSQEQDRVFNFVETLKTIRVAELTKSLLIIGYEILQKYNSLKTQKGILDYSDLIIKTKNLLTNSNNAPWISYKLDAGIDHVLVDEAQDTSPYQWEIINTITQDFFAGKGQKEDINRTIFVVGDEKQSIFSFQGADPKRFSLMQKHYQKACAESHNIFKTIPLDSSFRSLPNILKLVDKIFEPENLSQAISQNHGKISHSAIRFGTGKIEIWPLIPRLQTSEKKDFEWDLPFQKKVEISNKEKLAKIIAKKIKSWIDNKKVILDRATNSSRLLKYSDIMILLKTRSNQFVNYLMRELNKKNIPVTGIDRLKLIEHIAIKDLLALANFILFPTDNLNLANIIKSPILGLNEDDLFELRQDKKISLWMAIQQNPKFLKTKEYLAEIIECAKILTPYELFLYILDIKNGRKKIVNRFSESVNDLLNEFLNLLKNFEKDHSASLNDFLNYLKISSIVIKRDMEQVTNEVRVMTVHGAKGLQAPVIFLPDTCHSPHGQRNEIYWGEYESFDDNGICYELPFWSASAENDNKFMTELKNLVKKDEEDEYLRLLYVALTRAENEIYVCGWEMSKPRPNNWYSLISCAMQQLGKQKKFDFDDEKMGYVFGDDFTEKARLSDEKTIDTDPARQKEIDTILGNLTKYNNVKERTKIVNPSEFYSHGDKDSSPLEKSQALIRGEAVHKLLEILPQTKIEDREKVADYYLKNLFAKLSDSVKTKIKADVFKILENFKEFFAENSKAEISIAGHIDKQIVSGKIDRLIIRENKIVILDYKNSRKIFENEAEIPEGYKIQLQLYKQLIEKIYPDKQIECYILWTAFCKLTRIFL